mmetsp:Transcript_12214/g.22997  ORF Transcript_12214/g.22997 Transcript_12214/m.22997 type:complete len:262 (-) Transcript_12214:256-1041(-)
MPLAAACRPTRMARILRMKCRTMRWSQRQSPGSRICAVRRRTRTPMKTLSSSAAASSPPGTQEPRRPTADPRLSGTGRHRVALAHHSREARLILTVNSRAGLSQDSAPSQVDNRMTEAIQLGHSPRRIPECLLAHALHPDNSSHIMRRPERTRNLGVSKVDRGPGRSRSPRLSRRPSSSLARRAGRTPGQRPEVHILDPVPGRPDRHHRLRGATQGELHATIALTAPEGAALRRLLQGPAPWAKIFRTSPSPPCNKSSWMR